MQSTQAHVRAFGNGAVVEATFSRLSADPKIVAVSTAQDNKFNVTQSIAQRSVTLVRHQAAWVDYTKTISVDGTGQGVLWLMHAQPDADTVTVREIMTVVSCVAQLRNLNVGILMDHDSRASFMQHWDGADNAAIDWSRLHIFTSVTGMHAFVASRGGGIKHVCMVSGPPGGAVQDMFVLDNTVLHAVVHGGSFVYEVEHEWPMAMVHNDMPMLAAENANASVQSRGGANACTTVEIQRLPGSSEPVRLLYISKFCDNNGPAHPVEWLSNLLQDNEATMRMQQDSLLLSLILRAASSRSELAPRCSVRRRNGGAFGQPVVSPHLHRSVTQQHQH